MQPLIELLEKRIGDVMSKLAGETVPAVVKLSQNPKFGDYQVNGAMGLAKKMGMNPRQLADKIIVNCNLSDICQEMEIAGPGFINLRLKTDWMVGQLVQSLNDVERIGVDARAESEKTVVDFSGPNLAKEMHVGHLRSTIIGDVLARALEFVSGDSSKVVRQNHVGDWGLQFGMLVAYIFETDQAAFANPDSLNVADLEQFYKNAKKKFDENETFKKLCYECTVKLHEKDPAIVAVWRGVLAESRRHCREIYRRLVVCLDETNEKGESTYCDELGAVINDLRSAGMITESDGAQCVFMDGYKTAEGEPMPLIVQKSDGAFLYATTDLAAIRYRVSKIGAGRIIYVTDSRQKLHFEMVFDCAGKAGWTGDVKLEHVPFGTVLGEDNKPFKTRSGESVKLAALLNEAEERAFKVVSEKSPDMDEQQKENIARAVGIGAVKYADLSNNLVSDYVFSWDKMLAMEGNTAPYMQYAYARVKSIFRKGEIDPAELAVQADKLELIEAAELALAKVLLRYAETVYAVARELRPHLLTGYLYELAGAFSTFYNACPVLKADDNVRTSRLLLCLLTANTLKHGLEMLGIETIEKM